MSNNATIPSPSSSPSAVPPASTTNSPPVLASPPPNETPPPLPPPVLSPPPPSLPPSPSQPPPSPPPLSPSSSPPPPPADPTTLPPPNSTTPPPPPPSNPPESSPPPPPSDPPSAASPPPPSDPPTTSSPPPPKPPQSSPPPPVANPPEDSPPPPPSNLSPPPRSSPLPPIHTPPAPISPPSAPPPPNSLPKSSPSPPIQLGPPPSLILAPPPSTEGGGSNNAGLAVGVGVALGFLILGLIGLVVWCLMKRKKKASGINGGYFTPSSYPSPKSDTSFLKGPISDSHLETGLEIGSVGSLREPGGLSHSRSMFSYEDLVAATNGFSDQNLLGEGGFGSVYKGHLPDGRVVAVKQLKIGSQQGEREFKAEVEIISRIHHRHLVSLVGYCIADERRLLVYEYVTNNTLYFHLHEEGQPVMDWATRVKVAAGAARGINYLHEDCDPRIIHRDIKSSNILLDDNFEARVADFGLAKLALDANTHITTRVMGTFGYMAPEYASSGKLTEKSDVYSFGVVLLELITGRKSVDSSQPLGDEGLVEWARPLLNNALDNEEFEGLVDPRLEKNYVDSEMSRMIEAAAACVRHSAAKRPRMRQVVRAFDDMVPSDIHNGMRVGQSQVFDSAEQSAEIRLFRRLAFGSQNYSTDYFAQSSWDN